MEPIENKSFEYNGFSFKELVPFVKTERPIHPRRNNNIVENEKYNGAKYLGFKYNSIIIPMRIGLRIDDVPEFKRKLASLLHATEPQRLIFENEPDKYYMAVIDGQSEFEETGKMCHAVINWLVPDGMAHALEEKTFTFPEPNFKTQPNSYTEGQTWFVEEGHTVEVISDYKGKSPGSDVENANIANRIARNTLQTPSAVGWEEIPTEDYVNISNQDGQLASHSTSVSGDMAQYLYSFNVLEDAKNTFNGIFDNLDEIEQVAKVKFLIKEFNLSVWGRGVGPTRSLLAVALFNVIANVFGSVSTNRTGNIEKVTRNSTDVESYVSARGVVSGTSYTDQSNGSLISKIETDYANLVITFNNPHVGKTLIATKSSDTFNMADWEVYEPEQIITIENNGTYQTPVDIHAKFASHATSIGFVGPNILIQLGDTESSDVPQTPMSELLLIDKMQPSSKGRWQANIAQPRWRRDDSEYQSKIMGSVTWLADYVRATSFGGKVPEDEKEYWKGPSLSWLPGQSLENPETMSWFAFEPTSSGKKRLQQKGLYEINMYDEDNNAVMGFEMRDNANNSDKITYSFFVGDFEIFQGELPKKYWKEGFLGFVVMRKKGSEFFFQLYRTRVNKKNAEVQEWTSGPKTYTNNTIAGLKAHRFDYWMSTWGNSPAVNMQMAHVQVRKYNTIDPDYMALTFVEGDELFVEGATNYVYVNGGRLDKMRVLGSDQLMIAQPGTTEVQVTTDGTFEYLRLGLGERYL